MKMSLMERRIITITVMMVAIIEVLDMTIINVSLPDMMGSLGANVDQITWVLTSYIVASAIFMPLTGFLVTRLGRKKLLLFNIIGFCIASMLCGLSNSLGEIVLFRTLQGVFGAALVPISQYILRDIYPPEEQGQAMAIWGIGIMVAPVMGPTLGGYITQWLDWRWVFYINLPVCILATIMTLSFISETPKKYLPIDWLGLLLMASGIGCLQIFLDRGNNADWFQSHNITILFYLTVIFLSFFIYRGLRNPKNIVKINLFRDRQFSISCLLIAIFIVGFLGCVAIQPLMLENVMGYSTKVTGLLMAPRGLFSALGMMIAGRLVNKIDVRHILLFSFLVTALGTYLMTQFAFQSSFYFIGLSGAVQGLGVGFFFVPVSAVAFNYLKQSDIAEASGLFSFSRSIGSSIGISLLTTLITRQSQINWQRLGSHINQFNPNLTQWLDKTGFSLHNPQTPAVLAQQLSGQAQMIAFINAYQAIFIGLLLCAPLVYLLKQGSPRKS